MNREIKFRGKNSRSEWIIGDLLRNRGETFIAPDGVQNPLATAEDFKVEPETVGQFTGLLDKNGREIYEGDIITEGYNDMSDVWRTNIFRVVWSGVRKAWLCEKIDKELNIINPYNKYLHIVACNESVVELVGNTKIIKK